jgi:hypothetical protein
MQPSRSFRVSDALVLIAATALGLAVTREDWPYYLECFSPGGDAYRSPGFRGFVNFLSELRWVVYSASHFVAVWSLTILGLWLREPRRRLRLLTRQPGIVAMVAAVVVVSVRVVNLAVMLAIHVALEPERDIRTLYDFMAEPPLIPSEAGCAVAAAWIIQGLGGRWHAEPTWLDRTGRALGLFWIGTIPISWFSFQA